MAAIWLRQAFWQVVWNQASADNSALFSQVSNPITFQQPRGEIWTRDGQLLAGNDLRYRLFLEPKLQSVSDKTVVALLSPILSADTVLSDPDQASQTAQLTQDWSDHLADKVAQDRQWIKLADNVHYQTKTNIEQLDISGLGFEPQFVRHYPLADQAAHITGFVGQNESGQPQGYFGLEGYFNRELSAAQPRQLTVTIDSKIQSLAAEAAATAVDRYQAESAEVLIIDPPTGHILAMATAPAYNPTFFYRSHPRLYPNPSVNQLYEPGSTFKVLTVASGLDQQVITSQTACSNCQGPRSIGKYTIRTWNDQYHPLITIQEALAKSDNTAMIFITDLLGGTQFRQYLEAFGIGSTLPTQLQEMTANRLPTKWGPIEIATRSFGQGISTTSLELTQAINAVANGGTRTAPQLLLNSFDPTTNQTFTVETEQLNQPITPETAQELTNLMVYAAAEGEAQWISTDQYRVAGKTGTSQIPSPDGGYEPDATIASFVGFAPADQPKFTLLVKIVKPDTSPWAAETAAPVWYQLADKLLLLL